MHGARQGWSFNAPIAQCLAVQLPPVQRAPVLLWSFSGDRSLTFTALLMCCRYEPWTIVDREVAPWHDVRFRGYGQNKIVHIAHMNASDFKFVVLPNAFIIHRSAAGSRALGRMGWESEGRRGRSVWTPNPSCKGGGRGQGSGRRGRRSTGLTLRHRCPHTRGMG